MTYTSALGGAAHARRNISFYIAATIVGGYLGRTMTGLVTDLASWQTAFWMWATLALIAVFTLSKLDSDPRGQLVRISWTEIRRLVRKPVNREGLGAAFLLFFVSASMMNFLPFRMFELNPQMSTGQMAQVYTGYLVGAVIAVFSTRIIALIGSERRTLLIAAALYFCGVLLFMSERIALLYFAMFVLMAGMFSIHSVLSGYLNHLEAARKGMINGLYVSCYYSGGVLGSFLPGLLYQSAGWTTYSLLLLALIALLALLVTLGVMLTSTAGASGSFLSKPNLADLQDGDVTLASSERSGAGIHMSLMSPSLLGGSNQSSHVVTSSAGTLPNIYLSLRLPW
jgi:YNFM family putative membrane transporter